jgi:hypothetical protein
VKQQISGQVRTRCFIAEFNARRFDRVQASSQSEELLGKNPWAEPLKANVAGISLNAALAVSATDLHDGPQSDYAYSSDEDYQADTYNSVLNEPGTPDPFLAPPLGLVRLCPDVFQVVTDVLACAVHPRATRRARATNIL